MYSQKSVKSLKSVKSKARSDRKFRRDFMDFRLDDFRLHPMPKGLSALIPNADKRTSAQSLSSAMGGGAKTESRDRILQIPVSQLHPNRRQPRVHFDAAMMADLADSIRAHGLLQPIVVATRAEGGYEIIAGERRHRAAVALGLKTVPCTLRDAKESERLEMALIENIQRQDLDPIERAKAYRALLDEFKVTQDEIARRVGKPRTVVTNTMRFLELPDEVQRALSKGTISEGHAKVLAGVTSEQAMLTVFSRVLANDLSVRETEAVVRTVPTRGARHPRKTNDRYSPVASQLQEYLSARVILRSKGGGSGSLLIFFNSNEELQDIQSKILRDGA